MKTLLLIAALLLPVCSLATVKPDTPDPAPTTATAGAASASKSKAAAKATARSKSQAASEASVSGVTAASSNDGNTLSVSNEDVLQGVPLGLAPVYASGPCNSGWSAGVSVPGYAAGGGKAKPDPNCDRREIVRVITPLNPALALKVACQDPLVSEVATETDCTYRPATPPVAAAPPAPSGHSWDEYGQKIADLERRMDEKIARVHRASVGK